MSLKKKIIIAVILLLSVIAAAGAFSVFFFRIEEITVEGNERYTDEEIKNYVFDGALDKSILVFWYENKFKEHAQIPFVQKYDVEISFPDSVKITVYEKKLVGYLDYMGMCMYFDKDGIVVESTEEKIEGIPKITGVEYDYVLLHEKIPVSDEGIFDTILNVTQILGKYKISVDRIYVSPKKKITLYIGNVKVLLGDMKDLNEKVADLQAFYDDLGKYTGTLDMSVLSKDKRGYILQVEKKTEETTAPEEAQSGENTMDVEQITEAVETENPNVVANPYEVETDQNGEIVTEPTGETEILTE